MKEREIMRKIADVEEQIGQKYEEIKQLHNARL